MVLPKNMSWKDLIKKIPAIVRAVITQKNKEKFAELIDKSGEMGSETSLFVSNLIQDAAVCAGIVLDILEGPLSEAGIEIERGRALRDVELETIFSEVLAEISTQPGD
jgi:hypothetical protein